MTLESHTNTITSGLSREQDSLEAILREVRAFAATDGSWADRSERDAMSALADWAVDLLHLLMVAVRTEECAARGEYPQGADEWLSRARAVIAKAHNPGVIGGRPANNPEAIAPTHGERK